MKQIKIYISIITLILISSCGFKVIDKSEKNNFTIQEIKTTGEKIISFKIKNNLLINDPKLSNNLLLINIDTKKNKNIKEKNIKNEVVKYEISINVNIECIFIGQDKNINFNQIVSGSYLVGDSYSITITNEKKLINYLVDDLTDKIIDTISSKINDS